jgi:hypothetical protein
MTMPWSTVCRATVAQAGTNTVTVIDKILARATILISAL